MACIEQYKIKSARFSAILLFGQLEWSFDVETFPREGNSVSIEANKVLHETTEKEEVNKDNDLERAANSYNKEGYSFYEKHF
ncbi:MAG: hypothetical protein ACI8PB_000745 [Desulforhopalus sp.]|jgi:hypothetical protein